MKFRENQIQIAATFVLFVTIVVYLPALFNGIIVDVDDNEYVFENPNITTIDKKTLAWMATAFHAANWHPITWFSHALDYALWGLNPFGHHLTSILFHGMNAFILVILTARLCELAQLPSGPLTLNIPNDKFPRLLIVSLITGLLFGIHPLHVESVAWISERKDILCSLFFLLSILAYLRYASSQSTQEKLLYYCLSLLTCILSLFSKPMAVTLPVILLLMDLYPLKRFSVRTMPKILAEKIPFMCLSLAVSLLTIEAQKAGGTLIGLNPHTQSIQALIAVRAVAFYIVKTVMPFSLSTFYPYQQKPSLLDVEYILSIFFVVGVTVICALTRRKQKVVSSSWAFYLITLLPVSGLLQFGGQLAADRYSYLPTIGIYILFGVTVVQLINRFSTVTRQQLNMTMVILLSLITIFSLLAVKTVKQISAWKDSISYWTSVIQYNPTFIYAYESRGNAYIKVGKHREALDDLNLIVELKNRQFKEYYSKGLLYRSAGEYKNAINAFISAIELNPNMPNAYVTLAYTYALNGDFDRTIHFSDKAIHLNQQSGEAYYTRGYAYLKLNKVEEAKKDFLTASQLGSERAREYLDKLLR